MQTARHALGVDISTQTITVALVRVIERDGEPDGIALEDDFRVSRPYPDEMARKAPSVWVEIVRECVQELYALAPETREARGIGISTTFPGIFAINRRGDINPDFVSLYDNTEDAGVCSGNYEQILARAEHDTLNRMWPGNMAVGLIHLVKDRKLSLKELGAVVPPNSAFAHALIKTAGCSIEPRGLFSDFTETVIGGLYDARTASPLPEGVRALFAQLTPEIELQSLAELLPEARSAWTNIVSRETGRAVRAFLELPALKAVSIGAGDSALGALALRPGPDEVLNVRGSSDTPVMVVGSTRRSCRAREVLLHYPMVTTSNMAEAEWCAAAPILRSGRVWDWVKRLRFPDTDPQADAELERLATAALRDREALRAAGRDEGIRFATALGGERAPGWDSGATGAITGLLESHGIGNIALAALEGVSAALRDCIGLMEGRYGKSAARMLLAGGPARNSLWNWVTQEVSRKRTCATAFADASAVGAALLGYASSYADEENDSRTAQRLDHASRLCSQHPLIRPAPVRPPEA